MLLLSACLCLLAFQFSPPPQQFPSPAQAAAATPKARYPLSGSVVNSVTGEPIRRALVRAGDPEGHVAFTGPDGRFHMEGVPEGQIVVTAQKPGFFDEYSKQLHYSTIGPDTGDVLVKLIPEGRIQGRIRDDNDEPIEGLQIQLLRQQIIQGKRIWQPSQMVSTNEEGIYRLEDLPPGHYIVSTRLHPFGDVMIDGRPVPEMYPAEYYPNAPEFSSAQPLDLQPGQEAQADFSIAPVHAFHISGTVAGGRNFIQANVESSGPEQFPDGFAVNPRTGKFVATVPAGSWTLHFTTGGGGQDSMESAEQAVNVSGSDIEGLRIQFEPAVSFPVRILNSPAGPPRVQIQLIPKNNQRLMGQLIARPSPGDPQSLSFRNIPPGTYRVSIHSFGNVCIGSVMSGSIDLSRDDLTIMRGAAPEPIEITLLDNCATISGTVHSDGAPLKGSVLLIPDSAQAEAQIGSIQADGSFSWPNLSPGTYHLYAFSDISDLEYANPDAMRDFQSQEITVGAGEKASAHLDLIVRSTP